MISEELIQKTIETIIDAVSPRQIILFGSYARGNATDDSDIDLLIVLDQVVDRHMETVKLRRALRPLRVPVDLILVSSVELEEWRGVPGTVLYPAVHEGVTLYDAA